MEGKRKASEPTIPEPRPCPRCGTKVLLGDPVCPRCGYDMQTASERLKGQPAIVVTGVLFAMGLFVAAAGLSFEGTARGFILAFAAVLVIIGGAYYAADLLIISANDRRKNGQGK
jgi:hypothetical protein